MHDRDIVVLTFVLTGLLGLVLIVGLARNSVDASSVALTLTGAIATIASVMNRRRSRDDDE